MNRRDNPRKTSSNFRVKGFNTLSSNLLKPLLFICLFLLIIPIAAQENPERNLSYGETVSAYFESENSHEWTFTGSTGEIIEADIRRIAGRFQPTLSLIAPDGTESSDLTYLSLTQTGEYTLRVIENNDQNTSSLILNEYSLSLNRIGRHRATVEEGLNHLPSLEALPELFTGEARLESALSINIYGDAQTSQPDPEGARNRYLLSGVYSIDLNNSTALSPGISAFAFGATGIALQSTNGAVFYSEQNIVSLERENGLVSLSLADGKNFVTDFFRIRSIQVRGELVEVIFVDGQRLIAQGENFEFLRRGGVNGEGPNAEDVNLIRVNGAELQSDMQGWHTLAILGNDVRVYYEGELRYLSESSALSLFRDERIEITEGEIVMMIDPFGMGDIILYDDTLTIRPLDEREISLARRPIYDVTIENRLITIRLEDGSSRLSLPDGTFIESPSAIPVDTAALPNQPYFRPLNFNRLGQQIFDYHPMPDFDFAFLPVNRVNGNFFYQATDFSLETEFLPLEWKRSYNSLAPATPSPMGQGWRHNYQYDLNLNYYLLGEIQLTLPDGSQHLFNRETELFRSENLLSWTFQQLADGNWEAFTTEGQRYLFNSAGQLEAIHQDIYSLSFSPVPREYLGTYEGCFFVTDSYGRRLEVYTDAGGQIREVRDVLGRTIRYSYIGQELASVDYSHNDADIRYTYLNGQLIDIREKQHIGIQYDVQGRVSRYTINPENELQAIRSFGYAAGQTTEIEYVNNAERRHLYSYDESFRLVRYDTPRAGWAYRWAYSLTTGRLSEFSQPDRSVLRYEFDEFGYLVNLTDPLFGSGAGAYVFHYYSPDNRIRLLQAVDTPNENDYLRMEYDADNRLSKLNRVGILTSYSYDAMGRLESAVTGDRNIRYSYDDFGYLSSINEGDGARVRQFRHDMTGRLLSETDGRGLLTTYQWSSSTNRLERKTVGEWRYEYGYDAAGNLISQRFNEHSESYTYDALNHPLSYIDTLGRTSQYRYDEAGNLLGITMPDGSTETFSYDGMNMLTSHTDSNNLITTYSVELNTESNRTSYIILYPTGESIRYIYDALGRLRQVLSLDRTGEQAFNYNLGYTALGYLTTIEESHVPAGRRLSIDYDLLGNPLRTSLNEAGRMSYAYNQAGDLISQTDAEGRTTQYEYDSMGNLIRLIRPDETSISYSYDENGNRISYTEAGGAQWFYAYDEHNRLTTVIDPADNLTTYEYDDFNNLIAIVNANGIRSSFEYDEASRLTHFTDLAGNITSYEYNLRDNITGIQQEGGLNSDFFYDLADNLIALTQSGGRETLFGRDNEGRITSVTDSLGNSSFFAYNTLGSIGRITNPLGNEITFRWSASGRIVGYSASSGASYSYGMDRIGRLTSMNDGGTEQNIALNTLIGYDESGYIESIRIGTTGTINSNQAIIHRYSYTPNGQIASYLPPESTVPYSFEYDANGRMIRSSDPTGAVSTYAYDVMGNLIELRRAVGTEAETVETYTYDALGNITRYTAPDGFESVYSYDDANRMTQRVDNGERTYSYEYDAYGRLSRNIDPSEVATVYRYDLYGNLILVERSGLISSYDYDEVNNLRGIESPAGQSVIMTYNAMGQRVRYTDAENNAWSYSYDDAGNLSQSSDPLGNNTAYSYDATNRLTSIQFPNESRVELLYDNTGTVSELRLPSDYRIRTDYDRNGNLRRLEYGTGQVVSYERDNMGRLSRQINADGQEIGYSYDIHGNLSLISSADSTQTRAYDSVGRLQEISQGTSLIRYDYTVYGELESFISPQLSATYAYDVLGNLLSRDAGDYGNMTYEYDALSRPVRISYGEAWLEIEYDENGWPTKVLRSNGIETRYVYDDNGRVRNILHLNTEGERLDGFAYEYDAVGNIQRVTRIDNWAVLYSYNESRQVISERWLSDDNQVRYSVSYAYDEAGNRSEQITRVGQGNAERTLFIYNSQNQLVEEFRNAEFIIEDRLYIPILGAIVLLPTAWFLRKRIRYLPIALAIIPFGLPLFQLNEAPSITYDYDVNGNLISIASESGNQLNFSYDSFQRLIAVQGTNLEGESVAISIAYDAVGNIAEILDNEIRYSFIYDAFGLLAMESAGERSLYFAPLDEIMMISAGANQLWPLQDALGVLRTYASDEGSLIPEMAFNTNSLGEVLNPYEIETNLSQPLVLSQERIYLPSAKIYLQGERAYEPRLGLGLQRPALPDYIQNDFDPVELALIGLNPLVPDIEPERFVHNPVLPPLPELTTVHESQAAETARLLAVAEMAYSDINHPNILNQFTDGFDAFAVGAESVNSNIESLEQFAASLREVPLYTPLLHELPMLLDLP